MLQPIHPEADTLLRSAATVMLLSVIGLFFSPRRGFAELQEDVSSFNQTTQTLSRTGHFGTVCAFGSFLMHRPVGRKNTQSAEVRLCRSPCRRTFNPQYLECDQCGLNIESSAAVEMETEDKEAGGELTPSIGIEKSSSVPDKLGLLCGILDRGPSTKNKINGR